MKHPLSINFKTLLQYDFDKITLEEVIFFEWLIVKRASFGELKFFYQQNRIHKELGIKRTRLTRIKDRFSNDFYLQIDLEGFTNITHFTVSNDFIKAFIHLAVKEEFQKDLLKRFLDFRMGNEKKLKQKDTRYLDYLIEKLNKRYNDCRSRDSASKNIKYSYTELPTNKKTYQQLQSLSVKYEDETIQNAFQAFCDAMLMGKDSTSHMLNNFSSYDENEERFGVFERYLTIFNSSYSIRSEHL